MPLSALQNTLNIRNSHQRQIDEVTLCDPSPNVTPRQPTLTRLLELCTIKRTQCFLIGVICFVILLAFGHVMHQKVTSPNQLGTKGYLDLLLNITKQMTQETKLIREAITRRDYQDPQAVCPSPLFTVVGPEGFWSSCYLIGGSGPLDWQSARDYCKEKGGDLTAIESEIEQQFLDKEIKKKGRLYSYWIGGSDGGNQSQGGKETQWFWVNSNLRINYSHWSHNEPNNLGNNENCLSLTNTGWKDSYCNTKLPPICEAAVPTAKDQVKPHVFAKPQTICPIASDFVDSVTTTTAKTTRTTPKATPKPAPPTPTWAPENSTAKSCYLFMESKMSWQAAQDYCESQGGFLVDVDSRQENMFLAKNIQRIASKESFWWLGGNDFEKEEGTWIWTADKELLKDGYQDWTTNEPNNGYGMIKENCLMLNKRSYTGHLWSDGRCGVWRPSICEVPNPNYNQPDALEFSHNVDDYISDSLCTSDKGTTKCPNGTWTCYKFIRVQMSWDQAKDFCASKDMQFASFDSRVKTDLVYTTAKSFSYTGYYWLGASDTAKEGEWTWTSDGSSADVFNRSLAYTEVAPVTRGDDNRNCLRMEVKSYRTRMHWNDASCLSWAWAVCQTNSCNKA